MRHLIENAVAFQATAARVIMDMFGVESTCGNVVETCSVHTRKSFLISIYYTGTVYGEYVLALDEETAAKILGIESPIDDEGRESMREQLCDAFCEVLNMVVGECLVHLQVTYAKLTLTPPRVCFGQIRYPKFRTGASTLSTRYGDIECHFCLDLMRLDLATSYKEAMSTLLEVNAKLKEANDHLAQQQAQLVQSEKMASVGLLASGVAHEINNPLFFLETNLKTLGDYVAIIECVVSQFESMCATVQTKDKELLATLAEVKSLKDEEDLDFVLEDTLHLLDESKEGVDRIKTIVRGLKEFSQVDGIGVAEVDLNNIISNAVALMAFEIGETRQVHVELVEQLPRVVCHAGEIGQVIVNVLLNAIQATPDDGQIFVRSHTVEDCVMVSVRDTGRGIEKGVIDRVFDPFFTTRPVGEGTGLGLSISYGIVQKHGGSISVLSEPGKGATFTIRLPLISKQRDRSEVSATSQLH